MKTYDRIIVGAGITGAALAYELAKTGFSVLLLEQNATPDNATAYSYGGLAYWSGTSELTRKLCEEGINRHRILSQELGADTEFRELDLVMTIPSDTEPETVATSYAHFAIPPQLLTSKEACELEPLLNRDAISGALTVKHGHIHPQKTADAYIQAFLRSGGEMQIDKVWEITADGVKTNTTTYHSANIIICAGGISRQLLKSAGIPIHLYFTHAEMIAIPPTDVQLRSLIMPANLQRFQLEANASKDDTAWDEPGNEVLPPILDPGAIQFCDRTIYLGQISRTLTDPHTIPDPNTSETSLRQNINHILPKLGNLPGTWHHCLVAFSKDKLPLIGTLPQHPNIHIFSGFSNPLVFIPPLAKRYAQYLTGHQDKIITQLSPTRHNIN